jgi:hypothetical protein
VALIPGVNTTGASGLTSANTEGLLSLADGETATVTGLPRGVYTVTEKAVAEGFTTVVSTSIGQPENASAIEVTLSPTNTTASITAVNTILPKPRTPTPTPSASATTPGQTPRTSPTPSASAPTGTAGSPTSADSKAPTRTGTSRAQASPTTPTAGAGAMADTGAAPFPMLILAITLFIAGCAVATYRWRVARL